MKMPALRLMAVAGLFALTCQAALATQWKWRDADGRIQYSDRPPPAHVADKDILARPRAAMRPQLPVPKASEPATSGQAAKGATPKASDPELEARKRKADAAEAASRKADEDKRAQARAENCQRARNYLRDIDTGVRISRSNDRGEREYMDDASRARERERTQQAIDSDCAP